MRRGNFDTSTWFVPTKMSFPFSTSTVFGWYMALLMLVLLIFAYTLTITSMFTYMTSCWLYIEALCDCFKSMFNKMDAKITLDQIISVEKMNETNQDFKRIISFQLKVAEWVLFWNIYCSWNTLPSVSVQCVQIGCRHKQWSNILATLNQCPCYSFGDLLFRSGENQTPTFFTKTKKQ